jgi:ADP-ribose pyrophosphatase YjhB (NUDIX family)
VEIAEVIDQLKFLLFKSPVTKSRSGADWQSVKSGDVKTPVSKTAAKATPVSPMVKPHAPAPVPVTNTGVVALPVLGATSKGAEKKSKKPEKYEKPEKWFSAGGVVVAGKDDYTRIYIRKPSNNYGPWCFDAETEILTRRGWVSGLSLTPMDEVATLVRGALVYERPHAINVVDYEGDLLHFESRDIDQLVTPNHRMWVCREKKALTVAAGAENLSRYSEDRFEHIEADQMPLSASFRRDARWSGVENEFFVLPEYEYRGSDKRTKTGSREESYPALKVRMDDWLQFLGWFLSEGYTSKPNGYSRGPYPGVPFTAITQNEGVEAQQIRALLSRLPWEVYEHKSRNASGTAKVTFKVKSRQLWAHLHDGKKAPRKRVPHYVGDLSPRQIRLFLDSFHLGDGGEVGSHLPRWEGKFPSKIGRPRKLNENEMSRRTPVFYTASSGLADDLTVLVLKAGFAPKLRLSKSGYGSRMFNVTACQPTAKLCASKVERVPYSGKVWCPSTTSGVVYIRRNGKTTWSGNSFPKGRIDKGESPPKTALREVQEEIGVKAAMVPGGYLGTGEGDYSVTHYYLMYAVHDSGRHDKETEKVELVPWSEAIHTFARAGNLRDLRITTRALDLVEKLRKQGKVP